MKGVERTFEECYEPCPATGCWLWTAEIAKNGYGRKRKNYKNVLAHRLSWEMHFGPIPTGVVVMHLCDVPACVNPHHLKLGSQKENIQDSVQKRRHSSVTYVPPAVCKNGEHSMSRENIYLMKDGTRECRACRNRRGLAYYYRHLES